MTAEQWAHIESHFDALHHLSGDARDSGLAAIEDTEVRREVASLLQHAGGGDETVDMVVGAMAAGIENPGPQERRIGPYRLQRRLGQGGQGAVFEALRDDGTFQQRVAIKIVKREVDSDEARSRFRQERQILAGLEHPHIARLLDGGETPDGTPYLVMEFVDGAPLVAGTREWPLRRKLELFLEVAEAVTFAHRNLIVHRDLKPANILVTKDGSPKLLDFGIAKLLDANAERTLTGFQALTPEYASPEQVRGEAITTACDVYSLGVVLYEMLAGRRPYDVPTLSPFEIHKAVCLTEPAPPRISGDLDNILLMALRKDPTRRYASVEQFAQDVRRSLDHQPVLARTDSLSYRAVRFIQRNVLALSAGAAVFLAIAVGTAVALQQARIASQRFDQVRSLAHNFVFDYNDDLAKVSGTTAVREKMTRTALQYLDNLSKSAGGDLDLQKELASAYERVGDTQGNPAKQNLGHIDQAIASYRKAAEIHKRIASRDPGYLLENVRFFMAFANLNRLNGDYKSASGLAESALHDQEQLALSRPNDQAVQVGLARAWCLRADIDDDMGNTADHENVRRCNDVAQAALNRWRDTETLQMADGALSRFGGSANSAGRLQEALTAYDQERKLVDELTRREPGNPMGRRVLAFWSESESRLWFDDTIPSFDNAARSLEYARLNVTLARQMVASDPNSSAGEFSLATALFRLSFPLKYTDPAGAVAAARESVHILEARIGRNGASFLLASRRARALRRLAEALVFSGKAEEARKVAEEALSEQRKVTAHEERGLLEATRLVQTLLTSALIADALGDGSSAGRLLADAERISAADHARNTRDMTSTISLAQTRKALSEHSRKVHDDAQSRKWSNEVLTLWREYPDQNDFVRGQIAALNK